DRSSFLARRPAGLTRADRNDRARIVRKNGPRAQRSVTQRIKVGLTMDSSKVSAELGVRLVLPEQTIVPLAASLRYFREDPYAVRIAFHIGLDEPIEWIFARDLLSTGIKEREGLGDVTVWSSAGSESGGPGSVVNLKLSSPFGHAHFEVEARS